MRTLLAVGLTLLAAAAARADSAARIPWNAERPLTWEDFAGPVPPRTDADRVAETAASLSWSYQLALELSSDSCVFRIVDIESEAAFVPGESWVRPGHRTAEVLEHEQGHFDIAEIYHRRFAAGAREFVGQQHRCSGGSERRATRDAEREVAGIIGAVYEEIWRQYREQQQLYDDETRHGIDREAQTEWTRELASLLATF